MKKFEVEIRNQNNLFFPYIKVIKPIFFGLFGKVEYHSIVPRMDGKFHDGKECYYELGLDSYSYPTKDEAMQVANRYIVTFLLKNKKG